MDVENIFRDVKLSKTEMTVLRFIQNDPEQCIRQGVRAVAEQCYSNPSRWYGWRKTEVQRLAGAGLFHQVQYHHAEARCHQRYRLYEHSAGGGADAAAGKP
jgi:hypothetical protein